MNPALLVQLALTLIVVAGMAIAITFALAIRDVLMWAITVAAGIVSVGALWKAWHL